MLKYIKICLLFSIYVHLLPLLTYFHIIFVMNQGRYRGKRSIKESILYNYISKCRRLLYIDTYAEDRIIRNTLTLGTKREAGGREQTVLSLPGRL